MTNMKIDDGTLAQFSRASKTESDAAVLEPGPKVLAVSSALQPPSSQGAFPAHDAAIGALSQVPKPAEAASQQTALASPHADAPAPIASKQPPASESMLRAVGGSPVSEFNCAVIDAVNGSLWSATATEERRRQQETAAMAALVGIAPTDEVEGLLAAQLLMTHNAAAECFRRAMLPEQSTEGRVANISMANKCLRSFALLLETINRHRGKIQQRMTVEHVHVHKGGQAIVGSITI